MSLADAIRDRIDAARLSVLCGEISAEDAVLRLASKLKTEVPENGFDHGETVHRCPWHTCANTKHNWN